MTIEICADVIAHYNGDKNKIVLVERLSFPQGLALVGGRLDPGESLEQCATREYKEETGLTVKLYGQFGTYSEPNRDPRGQKVSTVFVGVAYGTMRDEPGKTKVTLFNLAELEQRKDEFAFDHYQILSQYVAARQQTL